MIGKKERLSKMNEITYTKHGDYYLPDLTLPELEAYTPGKYGMMRLKYLKNHRRVVYTGYLTTGALTDHLREIDTAAHYSIERMMKQMAEQEGVTEELKARDQMAWVGAMNNIKHRAEEFFYQEAIYV
jgi:hypothetical protein